MVQNAVRFCVGGDKIATATGGPYLILDEFVGKGKRFFTILNGSPDPASPVIRIGGKTSGKIKATILKPLEQPVPASIRVKRNKYYSTITSDSLIPYLGILILEVK